MEGNFTVVVVDGYDPWYFTNKGTYSLREAIGVGMLELDRRKIKLEKENQYLADCNKEPVYDDFKLSPLSYMEGMYNLRIDLLAKRTCNGEYIVAFSVLFLLEDLKEGENDI